MALTSAKIVFDPLDPFLLAGYQSSVRKDGCGACRERSRPTQSNSDGGKALLQEKSEGRRLN